MKDRYEIRLTKREAKQLMQYVLIREDFVEKKRPKPTKAYWNRHEKIAEKLQIVIYNSEYHYPAEK